MSDSLSLLLVGLGAFAIIGLAVAYIFTSFRRKKVPCPQCGKKTPIAGAYYTDDVSGQKITGEADIPFALVSASSRVVIGIIAIAYVFIMLVGALGYEDCGFQGISMVCTDNGAAQDGLEVNLLYSLVAIVGGVIVMFNGGTQFARALQSRGKTMTYEYICLKDHHWTSK